VPVVRGSLLRGEKGRLSSSQEDRIFHREPSSQRGSHRHGRQRGGIIRPGGGSLASGGKGSEPRREKGTGTPSGGGGGGGNLYRMNVPRVNGTGRSWGKRKSSTGGEGEFPSSWGSNGKLGKNISERREKHFTRGTPDVEHRGGKNYPLEGVLLEGPQYT